MIQEQNVPGKSRGPAVLTNRAFAMSQDAT